MSEIRKLEPEDFEVFLDISANAYPGWDMGGDKEERERAISRMVEIQREEPTVTFYGLFRNGKLLGGMRLHDFVMNFLQVEIAVGGVGGVAVDIMHKKEHVAKEMIEYFLQHYLEQGATLTALYPFRPDFYRNMGYGCGTKMNQYCFPPAALSKGPSKASVRLLGPGDEQALLDCYNAYLKCTHGMMYRSERGARSMLGSPKLRVVGCEQDGKLAGYLAFGFERGEQALLNDIQVRECIYLDSQALAELLTFLHSQADQIRHVIFNTPDEFFHHLLPNPSHASRALIPSVYHQSNTQGVGLMYRVIDTPGIFGLLAQRDFGGQTCRLELTLEDSFLPQNAGDYCLHFEGGRVSVENGGETDVQLGIDVADFSSLLVGAVNLRSLYRYGLARVSEPDYVDVLDKIFAVREKPICTTAF